jgi:hypothetical protein
VGDEPPAGVDVCGGCTDDQRDPPVGRLDDQLDDAATLVLAERMDLARHGGGEQAVHTCRHGIIDEPAHAGLVDAVLVGERGLHDGDQARWERHGRWIVGVRRDPVRFRHPASCRPDLGRAAVPLRPAAWCRPISVPASDRSEPTRISDAE